MTSPCSDSIWLDAPCAALQLWRDADHARWRLNQAGIEWSLPRRLVDADWQALAEQLLQDGPPSAAGRSRVAALPLRWRATALAPGWLLWLLPEADAADPAPNHAADMLALLHSFGRVGLIERDLRTGLGRWDAQLFRIFGLPPALQSPPLERAMQQVHPGDRARMMRHHQRSVQQPGRYEAHYRILRPDGQQRDMQLLTEVRFGADGRPAQLLGVLIDDTASAERIRAQQSLSQHLAGALSLAMVSVWRIDLASRQIRFNDIGHRLMGREPSPDAVSLDDVHALAHPDDLPLIQRANQDALASDAVIDVEARFRHTDGRWRHLLTRRVAERDEGGRVVALTGISLDQTTRIEERERAQALAQRIRLVADAAGVGVWTIDHPDEGDAERVQWNAQMFRIYGLPEDQVAPPLAEWMGSRVHVQDRQRVADERRRARRSGRDDFETGFRIVRPDGTLRWVVCRSHRARHDGRTVLHGIHLDVTQQRALDQALHLQEQRLQLATQIAGVGIWERDLDSGEVIWEEQMYRLRGLQPDDPRTPREIDEQLVPPEALAERRARIQRHLQDLEPYAYEFELRWPDGSVHWLASTGRAVHDDSGRPVRMVGLNWDVTQRRRAEAAQRDADAAERASRAKSEFLARMSHELRTPLNAMLGFTELLQHDLQDRLDAPQQQRLGRIGSAGRHLLSLIDELLELGAAEAGSLPLALLPVALDDSVDEVCQWVAPLAAEQQVTLQVQPGGAMVQADARRLRQVLTNLLTNAIKYNRRGGRVALASCRAQRDGLAGWELAVSDTGRGLSEQQLAHLYEPFNRLGAERDGIEGRGIGLMTAHHLLQLMGGGMQVQSRPGEGSEFRVWLPEAAQASPQPQPQPPLRATELAVPALTLLYVEDNALNVLVVRELLALRPGITLHVAADGRAGLQAAQRHPPDLVLADMQLPDMDGHALLRGLRAAGLRAPVVALSANAMPDAVARARAAGFDDYWTKPIDVSRFLAGLDRLACGDTATTPLSATKE
jgi:PAS domain S-box-containing protein